MQTVLSYKVLKSGNITNIKYLCFLIFSFLLLSVNISLAQVKYVKDITLDETDSPLNRKYLKPLDKSNPNYFMDKLGGEDSRAYREGYKIGGIYNGEVRVYDFEGRLIIVSTYINGKLNGNRSTYNEEDGNLEEIITYRDNVANGPYAYYYENGNIKESGTYENGKEIGVCNKYSEDGKLENPMVCAPSPPCASILVYSSEWPRPVLVKSVNYKLTYFYKFPKKVSYLKPLDKKKPGYFILRNPPDNFKFILYEGYRLNKKLEGEHRIYSNTGKLTTVKNYSNDLLDGFYAEYWENGNIKICCKYKVGKKIGKCESYTKDGKLIEIAE